MTPVRILIVVFYLIRCPVIAYRVTATALELARVTGAAGVTTYATEPSTKHPALSKASHQNLRGVATERLDLRLVSSDERIRVSDIDLANRFDSRQIPVRSPPASSKEL
jgi:hypothetical protein